MFVWRFGIATYWYLFLVEFFLLRYFLNTTISYHSRSFFPFQKLCKKREKIPGLSTLSQVDHQIFYLISESSKLYMFSHRVWFHVVSGEKMKLNIKCRSTRFHLPHLVAGINCKILLHYFQLLLWILTGLCPFTKFMSLYFLYIFFISLFTGV